VLIDFHHAVTYVAARLAGFEQKEALTVAHAAQYVDDATSVQTIRFSNKALYRRTSSSHKMLDMRNLQDEANHVVWLPFHFLPGNDQLDAGTDFEGSFIEKIICRSNSPVAREMVDLAISQKGKAYSLQLLGITMHVYADTWAHQGFAGVVHPVNEVEDAQEIGQSGVFEASLKDLLWDFVEDIIPPLGHGRAGVFPDMPFLEWKYLNGKGAWIVRNNTVDFIDAVDHMIKAMQRFLEKKETGLDEENRVAIEKCFREFKSKDADKRHKMWLEAIANGEIPGLGKEKIQYIIGNKKGSWKYEALGSSFDLPLYDYDKSFLTSDWKLFQDSIKAHQFNLLHEILPKYEICAA